MADLPENPNNREEEYLADIAGLPNEKPDNPWSRKEAYLDAISGRMDGIDEQIAALATDLSFKGSVADEAHLPSGAATGDTYITEDTGVMYVWTGTDWVALGGTGINVLQTTGTSQTDVMSQNATTSMVFANPGSNSNVRIGNTNNIGTYGVSIGSGAQARGTNAISIGGNSGGNVQGNSAISIGSASQAKNDYTLSVGKGAIASGYGAIAIGENSVAEANYSVSFGKTIALSASNKGIFDIGTYAATTGYNSTNYRLLTGLYDPQNAHDAATKGYVDANAGGSAVLYLGTTTMDEAYDISVYSDRAFENTISGSQFYEMINSGKSIIIKHQNQDGTWDSYMSYFAYNPSANTHDAFLHGGGPSVNFNVSPGFESSGYRQLSFNSDDPEDRHFNLYAS